MIIYLCFLHNWPDNFSPTLVGRNIQINLPTLLYQIITYPTSLEANISLHGSWTFSRMNIAHVQWWPDPFLVLVQLSHCWTPDIWAMPLRWEAYLPTARQKEAKRSQARDHFDSSHLLFGTWVLSPLHLVFTSKRNHYEIDDCKYIHLQTNYQVKGHYLKETIT